MQKRNVVRRHNVVPGTASLFLVVLSFFSITVNAELEVQVANAVNASYGWFPTFQAACEVQSLIDDAQGIPGAHPTCPADGANWWSGCGIGRAVPPLSSNPLACPLHAISQYLTNCTGIDEVYNDVIHDCEIVEDPTVCEDVEGQNASGSGYFFAENFNTVNCHSGCTSFFTGSGPFTFPYSDDPSTAYMLGQYDYATPGAECSAGDSTSPAFSSPPVNTTPPPTDPDPDDNGACPNGWYLQPDGSCSVSEDPSDPLNGGEAGRCIGYNNPYGEPTSPSDPDANTQPTGGGQGNEPDTGGSDGGGQDVEESGVDTDGDGETNDEGFCTQYPDSPICKISSHVDRGCSQPPACSGDAIQCAIDKTLWSLKCNQAEEDTTTESDLVALFDGGATTAAEIETEPVDVSTMLDTSRIYGSSCPAPYSMVLVGQTYSFDFAPWCDVFRLAGFFVVVIGFLISIRIIGVL